MLILHHSNRIYAMSWATHNLYQMTIKLSITFKPSRLCPITKSNKHKLVLELIKFNENDGCTLAILYILMRPLILALSNLSHHSRQRFFLLLQYISLVEQVGKGTQMNYIIRVYIATRQETSYAKQSHMLRFYIYTHRDIQTLQSVIRCLVWGNKSVHYLFTPYFIVWFVE